MWTTAEKRRKIGDVEIDDLMRPKIETYNAQHNLLHAYILFLHTSCTHSAYIYIYYKLYYMLSHDVANIRIRYVLCCPLCVAFCKLVSLLIYSTTFDSDRHDYYYFFIHIVTFLWCLAPCNWLGVVHFLCSAIFIHGDNTTKKTFKSKQKEFGYWRYWGGSKHSIERSKSR